jgi:ADP-dependent NAD(P)H-hydrate dehydratase / NAD(P)H-hydrate epimerase
MTATAPLDSASQPLISPHDRPLPLYTVAELRALEKAAEAALPPHTLMARAGAAAARFLADRATHDASSAGSLPIWIVAGPGNNGGDALIAAAELHRAGIAVEVCMPVEVKPDDARWALGVARAAGVTISANPPASFDDYGWLVDGMFGIGLARPLEGVFTQVADLLSERSRDSGRVLALDIPSGLDSDTGNAVGPGAVVTAAETITFIGAKPGLYTASGRDFAGAVTVAPLGLDVDMNTAAPGPIRLNAPALFAPGFPARSHSTHKGTYGSLAVIGGDTGMCGAPILAARAALYTGAGKVHVAFIGAGGPAYDPPHPELMLHAADTLRLDTMDALAIGCGMGCTQRAAEALGRALRVDAPKLIDADALNLVAREAALAAEVAARGAAGDRCVLTPHPLEAARLLGCDAATIQKDRLAAARALAARFSSVVVLKGAGTVIAAPDGRVAINPTGSAALATGGTGDVLGGIIGALLAQRLPRYEAALAGVYLHGLAADTLTGRGQGPAGLTAGELAPVVRELLNRLIYPPRA